MLKSSLLALVSRLLPGLALVLCVLLLSPTLLLFFALDAKRRHDTRAMLGSIIEFARVAAGSSHGPAPNIGSAPIASGIGDTSPSAAAPSSRRSGSRSPRPATRR